MSFSAGSIIANFTVNYDYVSTNEVILLQNAIEDVGKIDTMPVRQMEIVSKDGETNVQTKPREFKGTS